MDDFVDSVVVAPPPFRWIPIRSLADRHRSRVLTHLLALAPEDRYLRFGYAANDTQIERYVDKLDFRRDEIFGVFNRRLALIAVAHLAYVSAPGEDAHLAEFGVSVLPQARGRGYGARMFDHAVLHARNRGVDTLIIHALSENTAMLRIVRKAGAEIERDGGESEARLRLPPETLASQVEALVETQAAELNYRLKSQAQRMDQVLGFFASVRAGFTDVRSGISKVREDRIE